ncbi:MAG: hypothetical protein U0974_02900 [Gemmatimonadales bacterium]|nr:hypothetical protein [Gemmatimonadales bacterium]MDZ4388662.1 hypothetical protein [Gemmatimonadales bacterium]
MQNGYSAEDLLAFLGHAADRGLMPTATAQALAVASRNIFSVLEPREQADLRGVDLDAATKRFVNKRARDFSPASLQEYGKRVHRAMAMFLKWKDDPANFSVKTRSTKAAAKAKQGRQNQGPTVIADSGQSQLSQLESTLESRTDSAGYQTSFPVRPGVVVTIGNVPDDLTIAEAERLTAFINMLAVH